eukprot:505579-Rhodomonas_salina.1
MSEGHVRSIFVDLASLLSIKNATEHLKDVEVSGSSELRFRNTDMDTDASCICRHRHRCFAHYSLSCMHASERDTDRERK